MATPAARCAGQCHLTVRLQRQPTFTTKSAKTGHQQLLRRAAVLSESQRATLAFIVPLVLIGIGQGGPSAPSPPQVSPASPPKTRELPLSADRQSQTSSVNKLHVAILLDKIV